MLTAMGRLIGFVAVTAVLLAGCAGSPAASRETVTVISTVVQSQPGETATVTYTPPPPPGPRSTIEGDGTYQVGLDILPGVWRSSGPTGAGHCYWARLSDLRGAILLNELTEGPTVVEILPTDAAFKTERCQTWTLTQ